MKRSQLQWVLAALVALSTTGSAFAANSTSDPSPAAIAQAARNLRIAETAAKPDQATGTLTSIDAKAMTIVLEVKAGPMHFQLSPTTEYLKGGAAAELTTLTPGANARIEYRMEGTSRVATKIEVLSAPLR